VFPASSQWGRGGFLRAEPAGGGLGDCHLQDGPVVVVTSLSPGMGNEWARAMTVRQWSFRSWPNGSSRWGRGTLRDRATSPNKNSFRPGSRVRRNVREIVLHNDVDNSSSRGSSVDTSRMDRPLLAHHIGQLRAAAARFAQRSRCGGFESGTGGGTQDVPEAPPGRAQGQGEHVARPRT